MIFMEEQRFANVWDALASTPEESAMFTMKSDLMNALEDQIVGWNVTQAEAARRLGVTQPRVNDLLKGRMSNFSLDKLIDLSLRAGLSVQLEIKQAPQAA
jgi:predicted XRE-type DNA-binding protein